MVHRSTGYHLPRIFSLVALITLSLAGVIAAEPDDSTGSKFQFSGEVRFRWFLDDRSFTPKTGAWNFGDLRTRVAVRAQVNSNTHAFIQLQDARLFGGRTSNGRTSGTLNNGQNVDVHQAYLQLDNLFTDRMSFRAGRFEYRMANERLFGADHWDLVGRAFEGINFWGRIGSSRVDAVVLKIRDNRAENGFSIYGLTADLPFLGLIPFVYYENDRSPTLIMGNRWVQYLQQVDLGLYHAGQRGSLDWEVQYIRQLGEISELFDIDAHLLAAEVGVKPGARSESRFSAGVDWATGEIPNSGKAEQFADFFGSYHQFRGHLDIFRTNPENGLIDFYGEFSSRWLDRHRAYLDVHYFRSDDPIETHLINRPMELIGPTRKVGSEVDIEYAVEYRENTRMEFGGAMFFPNISITRQWPDAMAWFAYSMITVSF